MPGGRRSAEDQLLRSLVLARLRTGVTRDFSSDEALWRASTLTRRTFLRSTALLGAGLAVAACTSDRSSTRSSASIAPSGIGSDNEPQVVVVGAGLAGLTAAYRLNQAGISVRVFEARDRVGGRCWSSRGWAADHVGEHGGEFIDTRHVHMLGLARELGLQVDDLWSTWEPGTSSLTWVDGVDVDRKGLMAPINEASRRIAATARQNGSYFATDAGRRAIAFDRMTQADWIKTETGESIDSPMGRLFSSGQASWYGLDADTLSASNLIDYYAVETPDDDERYTIRGGNDQVPQAMTDTLPPGSVTLESALESVRRLPSGGYELVFDSSTAPVVADYVVLATPFTTLRDVDVVDAGLSDAKMAAIENLGMGTNSKVLLQFDQPLRDFGNWSSYLQRADRPQFSTWESGSTDSSNTQYSLLTIFAGGRDGATYPTDTAHGVAPAAVSEQTLAALDEMLPGIADARTGDVWLDYWTKDPWVRGSYAAFLPGNMTSYLGLMGRPEGRVHFAGEHTSIYSQGYLNGGAESGSRVAAEILDDLDTPYPEGLDSALREQRRYEPVYPWD
jgi:monoamine oxidase